MKYQQWEELEIQRQINIYRQQQINLDIKF
jgi:hypothetical protein